MQLLRTNESKPLNGSDEVIQSIATDLLRAVKNLSSSPLASPAAKDRSTVSPARSVSRLSRKETATPEEVGFVLLIDLNSLLTFAAGQISSAHDSLASTMSSEAAALLDPDYLLKMDELRNNLEDMRSKIQILVSLSAPTVSRSLADVEESCRFRRR